ncbi:MAG: hypothetical protein ACKOEW_00940 [Methylocystis sp.]
MAHFHSKPLFDAGGNYYPQAITRQDQLGRIPPARPGTRSHPIAGVSGPSALLRRH